MTAAPSRLVPVPLCQPGLGSSDWRSCSYVVDGVTQEINGTLCIPLAMCAHLRAAFPGGTSIGRVYRVAAGDAAAFSCELRGCRVKRLKCCCCCLAPCMLSQRGSADTRGSLPAAAAAAAAAAAHATPTVMQPAQAWRRRLVQQGCPAVTSERQALLDGARELGYTGWPPSGGGNWPGVTCNADGSVRRV